VVTITLLPHSISPQHWALAPRVGEDTPCQGAAGCPPPQAGAKPRLGNENSPGPCSLGTRFYLPWGFPPSHKRAPKSNCSGLKPKETAELVKTHETTDQQHQKSPKGSFSLAGAGCRAPRCAPTLPAPQCHRERAQTFPSNK